MKNRLVSIVTLLAIILLVNCKPFSSEEKSTGDKIDQFIKTEKLNEKTILVTMGYDAMVAIATQKGIVVIDAGISPTLTTRYRKTIEKVFKQNDFAYLINTHSHPDHAGGNTIFSDALIIGHENCPAEWAESNKDTGKVISGLQKTVSSYEKQLQTLKPGTSEWDEAFCQKTRYSYALNDRLKNLVSPSWDTTFSREFTIYTGDVTFNLVYFGKAHSQSDIIIHIPELKLLMTGDLFFPGGRPSFSQADTSNMTQWKSTIQWVMARRDKIGKIIGGHGQIMTQDDFDAFSKSIEEMWENSKGKNVGTIIP